jgi:hypothetical protein
MNITPQTHRVSTRIAVFIDFDNVEIGVKSTIGGQFDIGLVLEAIKERGEIVTKIAYSDWKRVGDYSRLLTQHAIRMVQRNMTPGGDKNGADITMALDALEMAFTHDPHQRLRHRRRRQRLHFAGREAEAVRPQGDRRRRPAFTSATMQRQLPRVQLPTRTFVGSRGGDRRNDPVGGLQRHERFAKALPW